VNIKTQYLFCCTLNLLPVRTRNKTPSSTTRAHSNGNPTTARILPTAGHRPIPSDKPTLMPAGQALSMATTLPIPSRIACGLRTTHRSQRVHGNVRRLHALLVQPPLPDRSLGKHRSNQRLSWRNQKNAQLRKSLHANSVFPLFLHSRVFPRKLLRWLNTSHSDIPASLMGSHLHRHSRLRHLRSGIRHLPFLQTEMVVHRHRLNRSHSRRSHIRTL